MKLKEGWAERAINCGLFNTKRNECKGLKDTAFVKYNKLGFCGSINCPFFKPLIWGILTSWSAGSAATRCGLRDFKKGA